jgi:putative transcriptional regulator
MNTEYCSPGILVAAPTLADGTFARSVVLLFHHDESGAMGVVVNRVLELTIGDLMEIIDIPEIDDTIAAQKVFLGGPVAPQSVWVVHSSALYTDKSLSVGDDVMISSSHEALEMAATSAEPLHFILCLGYAGWSPGQLESELAAGSWLTAPVDESVLFSVPVEERWNHVYRTLGIDPVLWTTPIGEA